MGVSATDCDIRSKMAASEFTFPIVCFYKHLLRTRNDWSSLVTTTTAGVSNGMFNNLLLVDSNGLSRRVKSARKLHGVGLFWGYNIFFNQRIRVELAFDGEPFQTSLEDVRKRILASFRQWHGWQTRGDFAELRIAVEKASTIAEIIGIIGN